MKVSVSILFSKNKKIGSRLIRFFTNHFSELKQEEVPSHVALLINNRWVHESTLETGVRIISYPKWMELNEEVFKIDYAKLDYSILKDLYRETDNKKYDWMGVIYLGFFCGLTKLFRFIKKPKKNLMASKNRYFCTEVIGKLIKDDMDMTSPVELRDKLIIRGNNGLV